MERSVLGTESLTSIKFLILKEENTSFIFRSLQYRLTKVCSLRLVKLDQGRYGNLKKRVQRPIGDVETAERAVDLLMLSRYPFTTFCISPSGN